MTTKNEIWGLTGKRQSKDGWRDDKFPRKLKYLTSSLNTLRSIVEEGLAIAYLPDYFAENAGFEKLSISGCPYECKQKVNLITKDKKALGWVNQLF
ncbi:MAG: hypothetical protein H6625_12325 [Bdellovibrionaceae bacterium]|nr:hypothetical protein [Pseudobdellovibrionaceae bacterium]